MLLIWYKFRHIKHSNTILCKHFSIKSLCAFDTCWWYNKMAYNVKSLYFTLHWCAICFSNRHFILVHLIYIYIVYMELFLNYRKLWPNEKKEGKRQEKNQEDQYWWFWLFSTDGNKTALANQWIPGNENNIKYQFCIRGI